MYYLRRKACGKPFRFQAVTEIDVYKSEPWELAGIVYESRFCVRMLIVLCVLMFWLFVA
ncbi:putative transcription factor NAM family [Helianthus debilis subsp. tardiflorus]